MKIVRKNLLLLIFLAVGGCSLLDSFVFPTHLLPEPNHSPRGDFQRAWINSSEGHRVEAWFFPSPLPASEGPFPAIILFHGNAELIDNNYQYAQMYRRLGFHVLLPEYRGYGRSQGVPGQRQITFDMIEFHAWLLQQSNVDANRIVYHGRSLGGGVACQLARYCPPDAMILLFTFTSIADMAWESWIPECLVNNPFHNDKVVEQLECPIFIAHGSEDNLIPIKHGYRLHELAKNAVFYQRQAGHNNFPMDRESWRNIEKFLHQAKILPATARRGSSSEKSHRLSER